MSTCLYCKGVAATPFMAEQQSRGVREEQDLFSAKVRKLKESSAEAARDSIRDDSIGAAPLGESPFPPHQ